MTSVPLIVPAILALYLPFCAQVRNPAQPASERELRALWEEPSRIAERDLFFGPWGPERAPDPNDTYRLLEHKHTGVNPGLTVRDSHGREWSVKQAPPEGQPPEGPIEIVVSRVLSAIGYHQPPVYFLPSFTLTDDWGTHREPGGRFRLKGKPLKDVGTWSWQQSPLAGTQPYQGLLVILMLFNSSDLKNTNNTLYERRTADGVEAWYVVRDLGTAFGSTGRFAPRRGEVDAFRRHRFITGVNDGFVDFGYRGWHQELVRRRITVADVKWAATLLDRLEPHQWADAFRAGGFTLDAAAPFLDVIRGRIQQALEIGHPSTTVSPWEGQ